MAKTIGSLGSKEQTRERLKFIAYMLYALDKKGSWCGLLHIQKSCYIAQEMLGVKLGYDFLPYKYGPYSFDLPDDVSLALNSFILNADKNPGYGPSYKLYEDVKEYVKENQDNYVHAKQVEFIANWFKDSPGKELEKITSAYMVMRDNKSEKKREKALKTWKEHLNLQEIRDAFKEVTQKQEEANQTIPF